MIGRKTAHTINVSMLLAYILLWNYINRTYTYPHPSVVLPDDHKWIRLTLAWILRLVQMFQLPFSLMSMYSWVTYFPYDVIFGVKPKKRYFNAESLPLIVVRIVTRGHYKKIIDKSIATHRQLFEEFGVAKYLIQVVTENRLSLLQDSNVEEILVPTDYRAPRGTLFKARNLTYAQLHPTKSIEKHLRRDRNFWLIHLDEETLMTESSMAGTLDMILEGKYRWGHGLVVYGWHRIDNFWTTYCDSHRCVYDVGVLHTAIAYWHRSQVYVKGGFIVMRSDLEDEIGFDFGPKIIQEDWAIAMELAKREEPIGFIEGAVMEESPETVWGMMKQRAKWMRGVAYLMWHRRFKVYCPQLVFCHLFSWFSAPLLVLAHFAVPLVAPLDHYIFGIDDLCNLVASIHTYGMAYGSIINFRWKWPARLGIYLLSLSVIPTIFSLFFEITGTAWGYVTLLKEILTNEAPTFTHTKKAVVRGKSSVDQP